MALLMAALAFVAGVLAGVISRAFSLL